MAMRPVESLDHPFHCSLESHKEDSPEPPSVITVARPSRRLAHRTWSGTDVWSCQRHSRTVPDLGGVCMTLATDHTEDARKSDECQLRLSGNPGVKVPPRGG
eukprot:748290-Rhodomonas_salina.1